MWQCKVNISVENTNLYIIQGGHTMSKLLEQFIQLFAKKPSALEVFLNQQQLKTHADVEFWTREFEAKGAVL